MDYDKEERILPIQEELEKELSNINRLIPLLDKKNLLDEEKKNNSFCLLKAVSRKYCAA